MRTYCNVHIFDMLRGPVVQAKPRDQKAAQTTVSAAQQHARIHEESMLAHYGEHEILLFTEPGPLPASASRESHLRKPEATQQ